MSMVDVRTYETRTYDFHMVLAEMTRRIAKRVHAPHDPTPKWLMLTFGQVCAVFWLRRFRRQQRELEDFFRRQQEVPITRFEREAAYRICDQLREMCKFLLSTEHEYKKMQYHRILLLRGTFLKFQATREAAEDLLEACLLALEPEFTALMEATLDEMVEHIKKEVELLDRPPEE